MTRKFLFVGERRSRKAIQMGVFWEDGRLAGKQLFDALLFCQIDPHQQLYLNWFDLAEKARPTVRRMAKLGRVVVGMGVKVQHELDRHNIPHLKIVHPAARGAIRKKSIYAEHVRSVLL